MRGWRPVRTALYFGLLGPAIGVALLLIVFGAPRDGSLGIDTADVVDLVISAYVIGLPPMLATGFLTAIAAQRGRSFAGLTGRAAILGTVFGAVSALLWAFLGPPDAEPNVDLVLALAVAGGVAGFGCTLLVGFLTLFRRPGS